MKQTIESGAIAPWRYGVMFALLCLLGAFVGRSLFLLPPLIWLWLFLLPPYGIRKWRCRMPAPRLDSPFFLLCLLLLYACVTTAWTYHPLKALEKLFLVALLPGFAYLLIEHSRSLNPRAFQPGGSIARMFLVFGCASYLLLLLESAFGGLLYENLWVDYFRRSPPHNVSIVSIFNPGFSAYALMAFPMAMLMTSQMKRGYFLGFILVSSVLFSQNQSAMLGLLLGIIIVALLPRMPAWIESIAPWLLLAGITLTPFVLSQLWPPPSFVYQLEELMVSLYIDERLEIFATSLSDILARPWLGYGFHAGRINADFSYAHPHNYAMQVWLELGIFGFILFLCFLGSVLHVIQNMERQWRFYAMGAFFAALIASGTSYNVWRSWWIGLLCIVAWLFVLFARKPPEAVDCFSDGPVR